MEEKIIFIVVIENKDKIALACFHSSENAMNFFKKHGGRIIQRLDLNNINDWKEEKEALEYLEIITN